MILKKPEKEPEENGWYVTCHANEVLHIRPLKRHSATTVSIFGIFRFWADRFLSLTGCIVF